MDYIKVGVIVNTHALKGEVKVKSFSGFNAQRFQKGQTLYAFYKGNYESLTIESFREDKGLVYVVFNEKHHINDVEMYKGCELYIDKECLHALGEDEVYYVDLMNCEVFDEEGHSLGYVEDVLETGANAVLRVNKTILIPYVKAFIKEIDIKAKRIVVHVMDGLL